MAVEVGSAVLAIVPSARGLRGRMEKEITSEASAAAGKAGESSGRSFVGRFTAIVTAGIAATGILLFKGVRAIFDKLVKPASDFAETVSKVGVVFGDNAAAVRAWSKTAATSIGQSQKEALDGAATFALYGKQAKLTGADLVGFSTNLVALATDMASISNTTTEEAIQAIGAAFRGESDPIEKYHVLMNEATLKDLAFRKGIIKTTKGALTPQQRILAVQAALYEQLGDKGSKTIGDFARTSTGLANQQRTLSKQWADLKVRLGESLLPVVTQFVTTLNRKLMPALNDLWTRHGPEVTAWLSRAAEKVGPLVEKLAALDFAAVGRDAVAFGRNAASVFRDLGPAVAQVAREFGPVFTDALRVGGVVLRFLAGHADTLAKALPFLAGAFLLVKVAQFGANVALAASPGLRVAEILVTRKQTKAIEAQTRALALNAAAVKGPRGATAAGAAASAGSAPAVFARDHAKATAAATEATKKQTVAQRLLNIALSPIGLVVIAVAALAGAVFLAYKHSEVFRGSVQEAWQTLKPLGVTVAEQVVPALRSLADWVGRHVIPVIAMLVRDYLLRGIEAFQGLKRTVKDNETELRVLGEGLRKVAEFVVQRVIPVVGPLFTSSLAGGITMIRFMISWISLLVGAFTNVVNAGDNVRANIVRTWNNVVGFVAGLPGRIGSVAGGMWDGIWQAFRAALNRVISAWNRLEFRVPSVNFLGQNVGGFTLGVPDIPHLASGGLIEETGIAVVHEGERVVPADEPPAVTQNIYAADGMSIQELAAVVLRELTWRGKVSVAAAR